MFKKLIMACMAVVAFAAFVLPATASAAQRPTLKDSAGVVAKGALVSGTNVGEAIFWNTALTTKQLRCTTVNLTGEVTKNEGDNVEASISNIEASGSGAKKGELNECTDSFGAGFSLKVTRLPLKMSALAGFAEDEFQVTGTGGNIRFDIEDTSIGTCEYEATNAMSGTFTTGGTQTTLTVNNTQSGSGAKMIAGSIFCPPSGQLELKFTLTTENGEAISVVETGNKPTLRETAGVVKVGAKVLGTNEGDAIFWNTGKTTKQVTCTRATLTGEVTKNETGTVEGTVSNLSFSGSGAVSSRNNLNECTDSFGAGAFVEVLRTPLLLSSSPTMGEDEFKVTGTGGNIRFIIGDTTAGECEYEATTAMSGTFTTGGTQTTLTVNNTQSGSGAKLIAGGIFCPSSGQLEMKFTLETDKEPYEHIWVERTA